MLTGISGSKTVLSASTIPFSTSAGSAAAASGVSWFGSTMGCLLLLGRDRMVLLVESGLQGVPGEGSALDPHRVLAHAAQDGELADVRVRLSLRHQLVEVVEQRARLLHPLALERLGHQRGRGG